MKKKRVLIDSDPATGIAFRDVDDGLAILFLLASPEITLEGITINFGNVGSDPGTGIARHLVEICGESVPVHTGAAAKSELGRLNPAVEYLVETVNANPGEISLLALAPLTNVATAMMLDRNFSKNLGELIIMGGALRFPLFSVFGEFNFHLDGRAAARVIREPVPKTLITMDLISQAVFRKKHLDLLKNRQGPLHRYMVEAIEPWLKLNKMVFFRKKGFFPWDPVAAAYLVDPTLFDERYCQFQVQETGVRAGRISGVTDCGEKTTGGADYAVNLPQSLDAERFMAMFIDRLNTFH